MIIIYQDENHHYILLNFPSQISNVFYMLHTETVLHIAVADSKSDRYSPSLSDTCMEWGLYYGIQPTACRVRKPRDKEPVESSANQLYTYIYARIQDEVFYDVNALLWIDNSFHINTIIMKKICSISLIIPNMNIQIPIKEMRSCTILIIDRRIMAPPSI